MFLYQRATVFRAGSRNPAHIPAPSDTPLVSGTDCLAAARLRILTARRADKSADRVRAINRLQAQLLEYFPALERAFDYIRSKAALLLLTRHRTPDGIRRTCQAGLHAWLKKHGTRSSAAVAQAAVEAAKSQHTTCSGSPVGVHFLWVLADV